MTSTSSAESENLDCWTCPVCTLIVSPFTTVKCTACGFSLHDDPAPELASAASRAELPGASADHATPQKSSISTTWGKLVVRTVGRKDADLILVLHGSGPRSSSLDYLDVAYECVLRSPKPLFFALIDCPGYGESEGSKQIVRSYPTQLISEVIKALGKKSTLALMGLSQGGAAVFNAALEKPQLAQKLIQDRPVAGQLERLTRLKQPTLLAFDEDDDGHPIAFGRRMARYIPQCRFIWWSQSAQPNWYTDNFVVEMVNFLCGEAHAKKDKDGKPKRAAGGAVAKPSSELKERKAMSSAGDQKRDASPARKPSPARKSSSPSRQQRAGAAAGDSKAAASAASAGSKPAAASDAPASSAPSAAPTASASRAESAAAAASAADKAFGSTGGGGFRPPLCGLCEEFRAAVFCEDCVDLIRRTQGLFLCELDGCDKEVHSSPALAGHRRQLLKDMRSKPVPAPLPPPSGKTAAMAASTASAGAGAASNGATPAAGVGESKRASASESAAPAAPASTAAVSASSQAASTAGANLIATVADKADAKAGAGTALVAAERKADELIADDEDDELWSNADEEETRSNSDKNTDCALCLQFLWEPIKTPCNHFFCLRCLKDAVMYNPKCPMCRASLEDFRFTVKSIDADMDTVLKSKLSEKDVIERKKQLEDEDKRKAKVITIQIEYGNTSEKQPSTGHKDRHKWTLFARVVKTPQLAKLAKFSPARLIESVEFDINPGIANGSLTVSKAPFELERSHPSTYDFDVLINIRWQARLKRAPTQVNHRVTLGPAKTSRRFVEEFNAALFK